MNALIQQVLEGKSPEQVVAGLLEFQLTDMANLARALVRRVGGGAELVDLAKNSFQFSAPDGTVITVSNVGNEFLRMRTNLSNRELRFVYPVIPPTLDKMVKIAQQPRFNF